MVKKISQRVEPQKKKLDPTSEWNKIREERAKPWFKVDGDKTLRLNYKLSKDSIVFDLGGYEGQWASDIFGKYQSKIYVFEPFPKYYKSIVERFKRNKSIHVYDFGLSNEDKKQKLFLGDDSTSAFLATNSGKYVYMQLRSFVDFCKKHRISKIDLLKINIEGGEFDLMEGIIDAGFQKNIQNIQIQFHDYEPDAEKRMNSIQAQLSQTHRLTYQYKFVWENWQLKK